MNYALIKDDVIVNIIVADQAFIDTIESAWDFCVCLDGIDPQPSIGWSFDGVNFSPPAE